MILLAAALAHPIRPVPPPKEVDELVLGSCAYSRIPDQQVWQSIHELKPDAVVLLGDIVYANTEDPVILTRTLNRLGRRPRFRHLANDVPLFFTWDDHDFGDNDSDSRHADRQGVKKATLDFYGVPANDPRRTQEGGIYHAHRFGSTGRRLQLILLDTRWDLTERTPRTDGGVGRYQPGEGKVLGDAQWDWLAKTLKQPAELRVVISSIPFAPEHTGWETWANFPAEQSRLIGLLRDAGPVLVVSGDVHYGELSQLGGVYDFTTSGLAGPAYPPQPNANRVEDLQYFGNNFGRLRLDWGKQQVELTLHQRNGKAVFTKVLTLDELDP